MTFGRPEQQGFNNVTGLSGWATDGQFTIYIRSEYQHSPSAPGLPLGRAKRFRSPTSPDMVPAPFPVPSGTYQIFDRSWATAGRLRFDEPLGLGAFFGKQSLFVGLRRGR